MLPQAEMHTHADDSGFTPTEIIIGVILIAILSTAVVSQALSLRGQAQDSSAQTTLRSAATAARGVYSIVLRTGRNNFAADPLATADTLNTTNAGEVDKRLNEQEPAIIFQKKTDYGQIKAATPQVNKVWVQLPPGKVETAVVVTITSSSTYANPSGYTTTDGLLAVVPANTKIRAGDIIRLGLVGASGSSFCAIIVQDSSNGEVTGTGWQSVNEAATLAGYGADCGATNAAAGGTPANQWAEMPNTLGSDLSLNNPSSTIQSTGVGSYGTKDKTGQETGGGSPPASP